MATQRIFTVLGLALTLSGFVALGGPPCVASAQVASAQEVAATTRVSFDSEGEALMLERINAVRAENGLSPLERLSRLDTVARAHTLEMAGNGALTHVSRTSGTPEDRVRRSGIEPRRVAENVALHRDAGQAQQALLESTPHRRNILDPDVTHVGLGAVRGERGLFVTQVFAGLPSAPAPAIAEAAPAVAPVVAPATPAVAAAPAAPVAPAIAEASAAPAAPAVAEAPEAAPAVAAAPVPELEEAPAAPAAPSFSLIPPFLERAMTAVAAPLFGASEAASPAVAPAEAPAEAPAMDEAASEATEEVAAAPSAAPSSEATAEAAGASDAEPEAAPSRLSPNATATLRELVGLAQALLASNAQPTTTQ